MKGNKYYREIHRSIKFQNRVVTTSNWLAHISGASDKESPANATDVGDTGSIAGSGRSPGEGNVTHSSILAWEIPWADEPGGLQSVGLQRVGHEQSNLAQHT